MKIAIFIDSLGIGGAQKHVRQLACGLAGKGHDVFVICLNDVSDSLYLDPLRAAGVEVLIVGKLRVIFGSAVCTIGAKLKRDRVNCIVTVLFVSTIFGRIAAQLAGGLPVLTCLQARNLNYRSWQKAMLRTTANLTDVTISNSGSALRWANLNEGVNLRRSAYIPNALDAPMACTLLSWSEAGLPQLEGQKVIGSLGRLDQQKGYDILLNAVALLEVTERSDLRFVIFGEGPERPALEAQAHRLGLSSTVFFPGQRKDATAFLHKLWLYVQPSRFEGTPNAVLEALASGSSVIASGVDGLAEVRYPGKLTLTGEKASDWADAIRGFRLNKETDVCSRIEVTVNGLCLGVTESELADRYILFLAQLSRKND